MIIRRRVRVGTPLPRVFAYLSDFTTTTQWDPGTISTVRISGDGGVGTRYANTSRFLGRTTRLAYTVTDLVPGERITLRGENATVVAYDTMTFDDTDGTTEVTYVAEFIFRGFARALAPVLAPAFRRLGDAAEAGLRQALVSL